MSKEENKPIYMDPTELGNQPKVDYNFVDSEKLENRESGSDFEGTLTEFNMLFKWVPTESGKVLIDQSTDELFSGKIHIKDSRLDISTYPNGEQKFIFKEGVSEIISD